MKKPPYFYSFLVALVILFIADLLLGSVSLSVGDVIGAIFGSDEASDSAQKIVWEFRMPRAVTACLVGAGLSISGLLMQILFRNPLAGPYVLGISSGASLGVALAVMAGIGLGLSWLGSWFTVLAATLGSGLVFGIVMIAGLRVRDTMTLLLFGLMLGSATGGIVAVLQYFSKAEDIQVYLLWTFGSLGNVSWEKLGILAPTVGLGCVIALLRSKSLNALQLGENYALSLGVKLKGLRIHSIIATCLMAGSITAFCGPIAFIGIAVPHFARILFKSSDSRVVIPASILLGSITMLICDIIAQMPGSESVLPINAVTAIFGAPVVIWLLLYRRNVSRMYQ